VKRDGVTGKASMEAAPVQSHSPLAAGNTSWRLSFLFLSAIWGSSFLFMHWGAAGFGAFPTAGLRVSGAAIVLMALVIVRGESGSLLKHWKPILLGGLLNSGIPFALYSYAVLSLDTGITAILNATAPLFGAVIAWAWLGERLGRLRWIGLTIGFVGVGLLAAPRADFGAGGSGLAVMAALAACVCYGTAASFARRYLTGISPLVIAAGSQLGAAAGLAIPTVVFWPSAAPGLRAWLSVGSLALMCTALAYGWCS
jgi:drug/metabolite transporter (DMT)-like permease